MIFELIAVVAAGFLGGGVALITRRAVKALPRGIVPVAAGAMMLAVAISLEYAWFERTRQALPDGMEVALTHETTAPWRPWTYAVPFVDRFVAVDTGTMATHAASGQRKVNLVVFRRWHPPVPRAAVFDCAEGRRADLAPNATFADDGRLQSDDWHDMRADHPVTRLVCA